MQQSNSGAGLKYLQSTQVDPDEQINMDEDENEEEADVRFAEAKTTNKFCHNHRGSINSNSTTMSIRDPNSCFGKMQKLLTSHQFHIAIVVLVIIDCLCVAGELIIEAVQGAIEKHQAHKAIYHNQQPDIVAPMESVKKRGSAVKTVAELVLNATHNHIIGSPNHTTHHSIDNHHSTVDNLGGGYEIQGLTLLPEGTVTPGGHHAHANMHPVLMIVEEIFKYASFIILCLFIVEILLRLIFTPKVFLHVLELLDTFVILISFSMNLFLLITAHDFYIFTGIITILRFVFYFFVGLGFGANWKMEIQKKIPEIQTNISIIFRLDFRGFCL
jgi:hypothetical protein